MTVNTVVITGANGQREASIKASHDDREINCTAGGGNDLSALQAAIKVALSQATEDQNAIQVSCRALDQMLKKRAEEIHDRILDKAGIQSDQTPNLA
ncbi:hypothetical protein COU00_00510 [Candidatus Falkowbacteria bacterium CG10_big_fil_rev_8_21_14_0_10_43_11]|uniref:Cell division protein ZapA n=1 Tax=Candidatus Falkowbacteria bacterium CG10_big_fil_rev_8_21_14_0_10_43_11 TaxID=1974568 RepID=A0A2M6WMX2_9BACT|nr:MAG: hypothetical protein COU00_00510 [Candidatus Falkowbacteria bacterium CG10_big_fil_rev_8_21_14_0_10_43_11]